MAESESERLWRRGEFRAAYDASVRAMAALPTLEHPFRDATKAEDLARLWHAHGVVCWHNCRTGEAEEALSRAYALRCALHGELHSETLDTLERLAAVAHVQTDDALATSRFEAALSGLTQLHGDDSVRVAIVRRNFAAYLRDRNRAAEARVMLDRASHVLQRELPAEHAEVVAALKVDALLHLVEGSCEGTIRLAERAVELGRRVWTDDHPFVAAAELTLATGEMRTNEFKKAAKRLARVLKNLHRSYGNSPLVAITLQRQAELDLAQRTDLERAEQLALRAMEMYRATFPDAVTWFAWTLFRVLIESQKPMDAAELAHDLDRLLEDRVRRAMAGMLANIFVRFGEYAAALRWCAQVRDLSEPGEDRDDWAAAVERWTWYVNGERDV